MYDVRKTVSKGAKELVAAGAISAVTLQIILDNIMGVKVSTEEILKVSGAIGILAGAVRSAFNWIKHRNK